MLGRRGVASEAKREMAEPAGNRIPVIQHVTSDAFVTVAICIGLLKADPEGSTLLVVKRENSGATSGLKATVTPYRDRSGKRLYLWAEGRLPLCPRLRKLHVLYLPTQRVTEVQTSTLVLCKGDPTSEA